MTDDSAGSARSREEAMKLAYSARMMLVTAALFVLAGVVWLVSGSGAVIGVVFVAVGLVVATLARLLLGRISRG